ncbi:MAG TPA: hypothetical protein VKU01_11655 [Bryobacteraceae bacterium]|nr:hypothetical protein [Bryobacteraceae bacterium]
MEKVEREELRQWVLEQTAHLDPPDRWQPDVVEALQRFHVRVQANRPRRAWRIWAVAAALSIAVFLLMPPGRVLAQQLWQMLTLRRVTFVRVNPWPEGVPSPQVNLVGTPIPPISARDIDEVRSRVHYEPRLPRPGVLSSSPSLSTASGLTAGTVIHTADLKLALRRSGITDQTIPPEWNGAQLTVHTSPVVVAQWPDILLAQSLPLTITAPANLDVTALATVILRILGLEPAEARRLAQQLGTILIDRNLVADATIEQITLHSGPATLVRQSGDGDNAERIMVIWNVPDRLYVLSGQMTRELAISVANAVP